MPKFNLNKFRKYVSKLDIENPQHQRKALKYVLDRSEYKPSERKTILNSFDKGDYGNFLTKERRSASWDDFAKYHNVYHTIEETPISKPDTSGFGHIRKNVIGPSEESVDNKWKNFVNWAKEYKQSNSNTTQPLQSGPISANDFAAMSGSDNRASSYMGKRLANRLNETNAKIKAIKDNADLSEIDKTKQINDIYSTFGDNVKNIDDVSRILQQEAQNGPDIRDYVHAYSGHVVGAGMVLGMGNAVLDAADTKGQKTNAQLYSNPF